jgi:hypothetical protein
MPRVRYAACERNKEEELDAFEEEQIKRATSIGMDPF